MSKSRSSWFRIAKTSVLARVVASGAEHLVARLVGEAGHGVDRKHGCCVLLLGEGCLLEAAPAASQLPRDCAVREGWPDLSKAARVHEVPCVSFAFASRRESLERCLLVGGPSASYRRDASGAREPVPGPRRRRGGADWLAPLRH